MSDSSERSRFEDNAGDGASASSYLARVMVMGRINFRPKTIAALPEGARLEPGRPYDCGCPRYHQNRPAKSFLRVPAATIWLMAVSPMPSFDPAPPSVPGPKATIQLIDLANVSGLYFSLRKFPDGPGTRVDDAPPRSSWNPPATKETG